MMGNITDYLKQILSARYGKDVRQAIHDGIQQCYYDGKAGEIDLQARQDIESLGERVTNETSQREADIDALNESLNQFVNIRIVTSGGFATMAEDIKAKWASCKGSVGTVLVNNGATLLHGTYQKYSDTMGSMTLHATGSDNIYVWKLYNGVASLDTVALNSDLTKLHIKKFYNVGTDFLAVINDIASNINDGETANFSFVIEGKDYYFGYISKYDAPRFGGHFVSLGGVNYKFTSAIGVVQI